MRKHPAFAIFWVFWASEGYLRVVLKDLHPNHILAGKCTEQDLVEHARSDLVLIAANAVIALTKVDELSQEAVLVLKELAIADQKKVLFGTVTIANLAFAALKWLGTKSSEEEYLTLIESVSSERREDVENLVSQGPPKLQAS